LTDIKNNIELIVKSVNTQEERFSARALRKLTTLRKRMQPEVLKRAIDDFMPPSAGTCTNEKFVQRGHDPLSPFVAETPTVHLL
jgi:hypothetical protein